MKLCKIPVFCPNLAICTSILTYPGGFVKCEVYIPVRKRKHEKYQTEVQVVGVVLIRMGFALATPLEKSPYSRDLHDVHLIHGKNLDTFFIKRVNGYETSSLKLKTVCFTVEEEQTKNSIESKTKEEIISIIRETASGMRNCDDIFSICSKSQTKQFLLNKYYEVMEDKRQESLNLSVEDD